MKKSGIGRAGKIFAGIIAVELIIAAAFLSGFLYEYTRDFAQEEFLVDMGKGADGSEIYERGYYTDPSLDGEHIITTEPFRLSRGIYEITVRYDTNSGGGEVVYGSLVSESDDDPNQNAHLVDGNKASLTQYTKSYSFKAYVNHTSDVRLNVTVDENKTNDQYILVYDASLRYLPKKTLLHEGTKLIALLLLADLLLGLYLFRREKTAAFLRENGIVIAGLAGIIFTASIPQLQHDFYFGDDIHYHLRRFYFLAEGLSSGQFPVKIQPGWGFNYGYAAGVGYGDLFLYPSAVLIMLGFKVSDAYKFYIILTNVITAVLSWFAGKKVSGSRYAGLCCSLLYTLMGFRLHSIVQGATVGEFGAYSFLPLVALGLWELFFNDRENIGAAETAVGIACVLSTHVLTTFMLAIFIPLFCLVMADLTFKKKKFIALCKTLGLTILLTLYFTVPLIEYMLTMNFPPTWSEEFWAHSLTLPLLFTQLEDPPHIGPGWAGLGYCSLIVYVVAAGLILSGRFREKTSYAVRAYLLTMFAMYLTLDAFPYFLVREYLYPVYSLLYHMEMTWHFMDIACILTLMLTAASLRRIREWDPQNGKVLLLAAICTLCVSNLVQTVDFMKETILVTHPMIVVDGSNMLTYSYGEFSIGDSDYDLPYREHELAFPEGSDVYGSITRRSGTTIWAEVENPGAEAGEVLFPLWAYRGYRAKGTSGALDEYMAPDHRVAVRIPAGYSGEVKVFFREPWYWRLCEVTSLCTLLYIVLRRKRSV